MITALEGFFLIILASVSFRISHTVLLCMLSNFGLNPVRAARAGYDTPQTLCTTEVPFSSSSLQRERFHLGFGGCISTALQWWGGGVDLWGGQRGPLSAVWLTRDYFLSSVWSFCYLCLPHGSLHQAYAQVKTRRQRKHTHAYTRTRKSPLPCWSSLKL